MASSIDILENAISDVGYWRWWVAELPDIFQVEFGGVQLWAPPQEVNGPPCGVFALQFRSPTYVAFLATAKDTQKIPADWPSALHEDRIKPFSLTNDAFSFSWGHVHDMAGSMRTDLVLVGNALPVETPPACLAFQAGPVGLVVCASEMRVYGASGFMSQQAIADANARWWEYWREYWSRRDSDDPMPKDYACEVTLPMKGA